jgi:two-component system, LytTR family, response regulator
MISALLVDDEPPARHRLRALLAAHPDLVITGEAGNVSDALSQINDQPPDLVFLDIRLTDDDGFELIRLLGTADAPAIVFVTAHADHAVHAWEVDAVDYLLKPFDQARLSITMARVRRHLRQPPAPGAPTPLAAPPKRIPIDAGGRVRFIEPKAIEAVHAERNYVKIRTPQRSYVLRSTLRAMHELLGTTDFVQVHRSIIVRIDRIEEIHTLPHGELSLRLTSGGHVISGRRYANDVRAALGI